MQNEKLFGIIRKRGTLGILALVLVGVVAFASYRTSYPVTTETEQETQQDIQQTELHLMEQAQNQEVTESASPVNSSDVKAVKETAEKTEDKSVETESEETEGKMTETEAVDQVLSGNIISPTVTFGEDDSLVWPAAGEILMDYSMDGTVYFQTLNEYKYNPALIISGEVGNPVVAAAKGIVEHIDRNEETGITLTMNIGDNYELIYGQLDEVTVAEGDVAQQGQLLGYIAEPTKYYCEEGSNLYFAMKKDGEITDPCLYLE